MGAARMLEHPLPDLPRLLPGAFSPGPDELPLRQLLPSLGASQSGSNSPSCP